MKKESSLRDAVGLVVELLGEHLVKVLQLLLLQYLGMKPCDTVHGEAGTDSQVRHTHLTVIDDSHLAYLFLIPGILLGYVQAEAAVDLLHDLIDPGQQPGEELQRPLLEGFAHYGMVRVCTGLRGDCPCLIPGEPLLVHEYSHELGYGDCRVCIVQLEYILLCKLMYVIMLPHVLRHCLLHGC